ncbi:putative F-box protein At1g65770 [Wolffia australiana]
MAAEWSELPPSLLGYIAGKLSAADQTRMAPVCKSWRSAMESFYRPPAAPSLWLLLPLSTTLYDERCDFPSFSENFSRSYSFSFAGTRLSVVGSSRGWLMVEGEAGALHSIHPITRRTVSFPSPRRGFIGSSRGLYWKAIFVHTEEEARPSPPPAVAVLRDTLSSLAVIAAGDEDWTELSALGRRAQFFDIAYRAGYLYAIDDLGFLHVYGPPPFSAAAKLIKVSPTTHHSWVKSIACLPGGRGGGEEGVLLLRGNVGTRRRRKSFEVLRLVRSPRGQAQWAKTKNLDGHALLLGHDGLVALPVAKFAELKADCVYRINSIARTGEMILTVTDLATSKATRQNLSFSNCSPYWFVPNNGNGQIC